MSRWRQIDIGRLRPGYRMLEEQSTLYDSSDDESIASHDDLCFDEGSSYSDSEPESLLKLVKAEKPSIEEAKHFLSDLTAAAADIGEAIEQKDRKGNRVIHYACAKALVPWVKLLIDNKADLDVKGKDGQRPLHFAVKGEGTNVSRFENAMLLLKNGADPLAKDEAREDTALHIILRKGQVKYARQFLETCDQKGYDMQKILLARNANQQCVIDKVVKCGCKELVSYCWKHVVQSDDPDDLSEIKSKDGSTLMHTFCRYGHRDIVQMLDEKWPKLLACQNKRGLTPLHVACNKNQSEVTKIICALLKESKRGDEYRYIHIGMKESDLEGSPCISLLKYAAKKEAIDCLVVLLQHLNDGSTLFELLKWIAEENLFKVLEALLNRSKEIDMKRDKIKDLTQLCAEKGKTESLLKLVAWHKNIFHNAYDGGDSLIHLIARMGHIQTAKAILRHMDVQTRDKNEMGQTALHLAIQEDHTMTSAVILKTDKGLAEIKDGKKMTPLMYACRTGNIYIVKLLLNMLNKAQVVILDHHGLNCLDHAIDNGKEMIAVELLNQEDWWSLMTRDATNAGGGPMTTPMRKLINSMPGVCKFVLDKCITRQGKTEDGVVIKVVFELLEDWYSEWMRKDSNAGDNKTDEQSKSSYMAMTACSPGSGDEDEYKVEQVSSNFNDDGELTVDASIHVRDRLSRYNNHPVEHMIKNDESKKLLDHPVVRLMFENKHTVFRFVYWPRLILQLTLLVFLTVHSLIIPPPYYVKQHLSGGNYTWLADGEAKWKEDLDSNALVLFGSIGTWLILVLTVFYSLEFLMRTLWYSKSKSYSIAGLLSFIRELTLQILIILFVVPGFGDVYFGHGVTFKADWQWELGAYAVLLAWINFIMFLQSAPFVGIYIHMFLEVIETMVNFLLVAGIFIFTFAVVFCILIINQTQYHTFGDSLAKSLTMLTDGIDFDTVFHPMDYLYQPSAAEDFTSVVFYPHTTHVIFVVFLFTMPIVVMNLLTGLAVYDIDVIQKKAKVIKQTIEAEGILAVQNNLPPKVWKRSVLKHLKVEVFKTDHTLKDFYYKFIGYKDTNDDLVAFLENLEKTEGKVAYTKTPDMKIDDMRDSIHEVRNRLYNLSDNTIDFHFEAISGNEQLKKQMQAIQDKLAKMCRDKVV